MAVTEVLNDCTLVENRLAVPIQSHPAVMKKVHRENSAHIHKDIVNLAEQCLSCTRYDKNARYIISKIA